jgi:hypothetical protein
LRFLHGGLRLGSCQRWSSAAHLSEVHAEFLPTYGL